MSRNIVFVIIILVIAVVSGYLVWLRSKLVPTFTAPIQKVEDIQSSPLPQATSQVLPTPSSPSAAPKSASPSAKPKK